MKILYVTDLHGSLQKYRKIIKIQDDYDLIIIGGDITPPPTNGLSRLYNFLKVELKEFFTIIKKPIIIDYANDDLLLSYHVFKNVVKDFDHVHLHHQNLTVIDDVSFIGMNCVPDYHFKLKDWCRADDSDHIVCLQQNGMGMRTDRNSIGEEIEDLHEYFNSKKSIEEELKELPEPTTDKVIYLFHAPPRNLQLDVCLDSREVGSYAITKFIQEKQPLITLHGHIHESPTMTGTSYTKLGQTLCIQPGQSDRRARNLVWCEFDTDDLDKTICWEESF